MPTLTMCRPSRFPVLRIGAPWSSAVLVLAVLLAGCGRNAEPPPAEAPIRSGVPAIPANIGNPYQGITMPSVVALQLVFDTVTTLDAEGNAAPGLAVAWRQEGPLAWIFELRPGITFSNGEPLDATALVESAQHLASKSGRGETIGSTLYQVESAERIDDLTVRVRLTEPDALLPIHLAVWRVPAPRHWKTLQMPAGASDAVGSGPFTIAERRDGQLLLRANPRAWRKASSPAIQLLLIPEATARVQAFTSGAVDMAMVVMGDSRPAVERSGGRLVTRLTPLVDYIGFITEGRDTPLDDVRVRRAINMAVDRASLTHNILNDATRPASQLTMPGAFGYNAALEPIAFDPAGARRLLEEAGHGGGLKLSMAVTTGEVSGDSLYFQQIGTDLKNVGIEVEIRARPIARHMQDIFTGTATADMFSWNSRGADPLTDFRLRSCQRTAPTRMPYHCDRRVTEMVKAALAEGDLEKRRQLYSQILAYERDNPPGLLLWQRPDFDAVSGSVAGYQPIQDALQFERLSRVAAR